MKLLVAGNVKLCFEDMKVPKMLWIQRNREDERVDQMTKRLNYEAKQLINDMRYKDVLGVTGV